MQKNDIQFYSPVNQLHHRLDEEALQILENAPPVWSSKQKYTGNGVERKYIFISYSHKDFRFVYNDLHKLWSVNAHYWYDREFRYSSDFSSSTDSWRSSAESIILHDPNCVGMVFYVSKNSFMSDAVHHEIECCRIRREKDPNFSYLVVLIGGHDIFEIQNQCQITSKTFSSQKMLNIHQIWGDEHLCVNSTDEYEHLFSIVRFFVNCGCVNDIDFDYAHKVILRPGYIIVGDQLISYFRDGTRFELDEQDAGIVKHIQINAISGANLEEIRIPEGVQSVGDFAIAACPNLKKLYLPKSLTQLSFYALSNFNYSIIEIHPDNPCFTIGPNDMVFSKVDGRITSLVAVPNHNPVSEIVLPEGITVLNDFVISNCVELHSIIFPSTLNCIGYWSVSNNPALTSITIHPSICYISQDAFMGTDISKLTVHFMGTREQFESHEKVNAQQTLRELFSQANIVFEAENSVQCGE